MATIVLRVRLLGGEQTDLTYVDPDQDDEDEMVDVKTGHRLAAAAAALAGGLQRAVRAAIAARPTRTEVPPSEFFACRQPRRRLPMGAKSMWKVTVTPSCSAVNPSAGVAQMRGRISNPVGSHTGSNTHLSIIVGYSLISHEGAA